jgi:dihydropteroate synthase
LLAIERGASIVRVHDVKQTVIALKVRQAIKLESVF